MFSQDKQGNVLTGQCSGASWGTVSVVRGAMVKKVEFVSSLAKLEISKISLFNLLSHVNLHRPIKMQYITRDNSKSMWVLMY
jgi:hypothetical protein